MAGTKENKLQGTGSITAIKDSGSTKSVAEFEAERAARLLEANISAENKVKKTPEIDPRKEFEVVVRVNDMRKRKMAIDVSGNYTGKTFAPNTKVKLTEDLLQILDDAKYGPVYEVQDEDGETIGYEQDKLYSIKGWTSPFDIEDED